MAYSGLRLSATFLVESDLRANGGYTGALTIPLGVAWSPTPSVRVYLEGGAIGGINWGYTYFVPRQTNEVYSLNFYGALGLGYVFDAFGAP